MIVPTYRLLLWFALVSIPASVVGLLLPGLGIPALALVGLLSLAALWDALQGLGKMGRIDVALPGTIRLSKCRPGILPLRVQHRSKGPASFRVGLPWPEGVQADEDSIQVNTDGEGGWTSLEWPCRPIQRGHFRMNKVHLEHASPFGFWHTRSVIPIQTELRVYPNLLQDRRQLAGLFLNRGMVGLHAQRQVGKGREFEQLREYSPGDGFEDIHWKATAKRGHPVTKVFQIERTQELYVLVDSSRLTARQGGILDEPAQDGAAPKETMLDRFITAALVLGLAAEQQGDHFGMVTFSNKVNKFIRAKNGQSHFSTCRDALYTLQPQAVTPDFQELATFIRLRLRRRALLIILTSLDDPVIAENFVQSMQLLSRQHLVLANMTTPKGVRPVFSNNAVSTLGDLYANLAGHLRWSKLQELERVLKRIGVTFHLLEKERLSVELISQYMSVKRRQLL